MMRPREFHPSVTALESRWLPTAIYANPYDNAVQASYVDQTRTATNPIVFVGDSITYNWGTATRQAPGSSVFAKDFAPLGAANFGIVGDTTANVIARVRAGDLMGQPRVAVVMIGFNDLYLGETPLQAATGVLGVVQAIEAASPTTSILVLGALPSDDLAMNPEIQQLDGMISVLGTAPGVTYENPGAQLLGANGAARSDLLIDFVHPDQAGYSLIADAIDGTVVRLLQKSEYSADRPIPARPATRVKAAAVVVPRPPAETPTGPDAGPSLPPAAAPSIAIEVVATPSIARPRVAVTELITVTST